MAIKSQELFGDICENRNCLICDDHVLFRDTLGSIFETRGANVRLAENYKEAVTRLSEETFDCVICDLVMDDFTEEGAIQVLVAAVESGARVILMTASTDRHLVRRICSAGIHGCIYKTSSLKLMQKTVEYVLDGGTAFPPDLITLRPEISAHVLEVLNEREACFLGLLLKGKQNKEIADETGVSDHLVKMILNSIFVKLGVRNRTQAVLVALGFEV